MYFSPFEGKGGTILFKIFRCNDGVTGGEAETAFLFRGEVWRLYGSKHSKHRQKGEGGTGRDGTQDALAESS